MVKEPVILINPGINCMLSRDPVKSSFNFSVGLMATALCLFVVSTVYLFNLAAGFILLKACALNNICAFKPDFSFRSQPEELPGGIFHKVIPLNKYLPAERNHPGTHRFIFGIINYFKFFYFIFRVIAYYQFNRVYYSKNSWSNPVKIFLYGMFQQGHIINCFDLCIANAVNKVFN